MATMRALTFDTSRESWEGSKGMVVDRVEVPTLGEGPDQSCCIVRVRYAGFCGTDRGIWWRKSMGDMVLSSLAEDGATKRTFGHELLGEIVEVGSKVVTKYGYKIGDMVSTESHVVCGACYQCRLGEFHVCANERIIGVSMDGCFAEYVKIPAKALWPTDLSKIRPEVAAIQEPFGNAVHACQITDLRGKTVAILGTGTIGLFAVLIARGMGAGKVIGIEPDARHRELASRLGCDEVLVPTPAPKDAPWTPDPALRERVLELTDGVGVDVAMDMAGFESSVNNAVRLARRGGHIVLFGLRNGDTRIADFHRIIMDGKQLHGVVGRRLFQTWEMTRSLLENTQNGVQDAVWDVILNKGEGTIVDAATFDPAAFEDVMARHTKPVLRWGG
ncbi:MAG: alcohol dehydrogenase catalytic domain-containing protein [Myxococcales bacterium]|nr:alcohol dehydrogenase catalytic domain-containing protein [Myxococcales bacterium]